MALYTGLFFSILIIIYALFRVRLMRFGLAFGLVVLLFLESIAPSQVETGLKATSDIARSMLRNLSQATIEGTHGKDPLVDKYIKCWEDEGTFIPSDRCKKSLIIHEDLRKNETYIENKYSRRLPEQ